MNRQKFIDMPCKACDVGKVYEHGMCEKCYLRYIDSMALLSHRGVPTLTPQQHLDMTRTMNIGWGEALKEYKIATQ